MKSFHLSAALVLLAGLAVVPVSAAELGVPGGGTCYADGLAGCKPLRAANRGVRVTYGPPVRMYASAPVFIVDQGPQRIFDVVEPTVAYDYGVGPYLPGFVYGGGRHHKYHHHARHHVGHHHHGYRRAIVSPGRYYGSRPIARVMHRGMTPARTMPSRPAGGRLR